ncbi:hypothetical protein TI39_contig4325g00003 [Zymoseptoria brevis]|uniref:Uncharacterized protein n=1 Tax=Zymoseptoria brevis TaxID=1047168 RepID=A0A0F4GAY3_9PEZI|nr:hypothetical protein TI39_contig4325g00003 [Zymoseptoria brevis]
MECLSLSATISTARYVAKVYIDNRCGELISILQDRQLQLAMRSIEACDQIVQLFLQMGMQFQPPQQKTKKKPVTTHSDDPPGMGPSDRPSTTQKSSNFRPPVRSHQPSPFSLPNLDVGSLSHQPSVETRKAQQISSSVGGSGITTERRFFTRDGELLSRSIAPPQPSNEGLWGASTPKAPSAQQSNVPLAASQQKLGRLDSGRASSGSNVAAMSAVQRSWAPFDSGVDAFPLSDTVAPQQNVSSDTIDGQYYTPLHSSLREPPRSGGVATSSPAPLETLEHEIPPRHELPFKVPGSRGSNASRPSSSALSLPPLRRPTTADHRPTTAGVRPTAAVKPQTPSNKTNNRSNNQKNDVRPSTSHSGSQAPKTKDARPSTSHSTTQGVKKKVQPTQSNISFAAAKRPLHDVDTTSAFESKRARISSLIDAPHELESPADTAWTSMPAPAQKSKNPATLYEDGMTERDAVGEAFEALSSSYRVQERVQESASLEEYAAQDGKTRLAALEQFMVDNLQNPSFTTLCEDMESCWQRIAIGL